MLERGHLWGGQADAAYHRMDTVTALCAQLPQAALQKAPLDMCPYGPF